MLKRYKTLDSTWKELLFALSGFGPNLLMILMGAFYSDAINPSALLVNNENAIYQTINGLCLISPALFPILMTLAKAFDGIIDVPFASITDNLKSKWGKRRLPIAIAFVPMVVSFALCWVPLRIGENSRLNTIWFTVNTFIFFASYTMCLIAFYGSLSNVCSSEKQRLRVSSYKSFFDTICYCLVYALVPLILDLSKIHIDKLVFILLPLMATMLIPLFMIKEGEKFEKRAIAEGFDITPLKEEERTPIFKSIKLTFKNKSFVKWCIINCCSFFGLQMFLVAMNALIMGGMNLNGAEMAILNTCAFAPVPVMLYLFNKLKAKKGIRFAYQSCLLCFAVCILTFFFGSSFILGPENKTIKIIIGVVGGIVGSWAIGSFFMMPYMIPAQISSVEEKLTKRNRSSMYFAIQALTTSIIGALASGLVYEYIKNIFINKSTGQIVYVGNGTGLKGAVESFGLTGAAEEVIKSTVFNFGTMILPFIVSLMCIIGFIVAFKMPKNYTPKLVAKELNLEKEYEENKHLFTEEEDKDVEKDSIGVNAGLWVLSGSIFGYIWNFGIRKVANYFADKKINIVHVILSIIIPFYNIYFYLKADKILTKALNDRGVVTKKSTIFIVVFGILFLSVVPLGFLQHKVNKLSKVLDTQSVKTLEVEVAK